ncbi:unnamed protein product [Calypogeia fissa]
MEWRWWGPTHLPRTLTLTSPTSRRLAPLNPLLLCWTWALNQTPPILLKIDHNVHKASKVHKDKLQQDGGMKLGIAKMTMKKPSNKGKVTNQSLV